MRNLVLVVPWSILPTNTSSDEAILTGAYWVLDEKSWTLLTIRGLGNAERIFPVRDSSRKRVAVVNRNKTAA